MAQAIYRNHGIVNAQIAILEILDQGQGRRVCRRGGIRLVRLAEDGHDRVLRLGENVPVERPQHPIAPMAAVV